MALTNIWCKYSVRQSDLSSLLSKFLDALPNSKCLSLSSVEGGEIVSIGTSSSKEESKLLNVYSTSFTNSDDHV